MIKIEVICKHTSQKERLMKLFSESLTEELPLTKIFNKSLTEESPGHVDSQINLTDGTACNTFVLSLGDSNSHDIVIHVESKDLDVLVKEIKWNRINL